MSNPDALYHYCSTAAFHSIVDTRSVHLSSLSLSNDTMEGKLVAQALQRLGERDSLLPETRSRLLEMFGALERVFDGLGFCLSEDGDLLSQWRGYASDATGVSIGFSRSYLEWLAARPRNDNETLFGVNKVQYEPELHDKEVEPTYIEVRRLIDAGAFSFSGIRGLLDSRTDEEFELEQKKATELLNKLSMALFKLFPKLFLLKSMAFREELEWRLLSHLVHEISDDCFFRPSHDKLVPYRVIPLVEEGNLKPIVEVVLGPKHLTPTHVVATFLEKSGFGEVPVRRSNATYR